MNATAIKERPILFSAPMINALLEGLKTQTRRIMKPQPEGRPMPLAHWARGLADACGVSPSREEIHAKAERLRGRVFPFERKDSERLYSPPCPYGYPGDRLWVKETHLRNGDDVMYRDDPDYELCEPAKGEKPGGINWRKVSSLFMPRALSRITLEITDVKVQRVEEISEQDALAEGIVSEQCSDGRVYKSRGADDWHPTGREAFLALFYDINKRAKRGENPWVWALTFKVIKPQS